MRQFTRISTFVFIAIFAFSGVALAGKGKKGKNDKKTPPSPFDAAIEFILDHDTDLKITPDQVAKLDALQEAYGKYCQDPSVMGAVKDFRHARKTGTAKDVEAANAAMNAKLREKSGGILNGLQPDLGRILNSDQVKKYLELRSKSVENQPDADAAKSLVPFGL